MSEVLRIKQEVKKLDRPRVWELEKRVDAYRVSVGEHEYTHVFAIWGVGKSTHGATVEPSSDYEGATFPPSDMTVKQMQIAAMASADHAGNGSDKMKANILQFNDGMPVEQAESIAKGIVSSYSKKVRYYASVFLANKGSASDDELRQFVRWAEEDIREQQIYGDLPLPSFTDEFYELRNESKEINDSSEDEGEEIILITYQKDGSQIFHLANGSEKVFCPLCHEVDGHQENCPENKEKPFAEEYVIFDVKKAKRYFLPN